MSAVFTLLFLGGWTVPLTVACSSTIAGLIFSFKTIILCFAFVLARATIPRYRYDQLMDIGWKIFLPFNILYLLCLAAFFFI